MYWFIHSSRSLKLLYLILLSVFFFSVAPATDDNIDWALGSKQLQDSCISDSPALAVFNDKLYLAHQGEKENGELWCMSTPDAQNWGKGKKIEGIGMSCSPALAVFNGKLYLAHQGVGKSGQLWCTSTPDAQNWGKGKKIEGVGMSCSPALAVFNGKLYLAHQGVGKSGQLWYISTTNGEEWEKDRLIKDIGISGSPSLAAFKGRLYLAHQGWGATGQLWYTSTADGENWEKDRLIKDVGTSGSPALAVFKDRLYLAHQGWAENGQLWYTFTTDGENWAPDRQLHNVGISNSPAWAAFKNDLHLGYQGERQTNQLWVARFLKAVLQVTLRDFNFKEDAKVKELLLNHKKPAFISTQHMEISEDNLGAKIGGTYGESIGETFSWGLNQKIGATCKTMIKSGIPFLAEGKVEVAGSFEFGAHEDWSTTRLRSFSVNAEISPASKGRYKLGIKVYRAEDVELPFSAKVDLRAIRSEPFDCALDSRFLNSDTVKALFRYKGLDEGITISDGSDGKSLVLDVDGTLKADYGVWKDVIAKKVADSERGGK